MHVARHTFAASVTLSNGVPIETVSKMLDILPLFISRAIQRTFQKIPKRKLSLANYNL